ncbi:MAG: hypothetical protein WBK55_06535 [Alphaproteobacteria bacterium]
MSDFLLRDYFNAAWNYVSELVSDPDVRFLEYRVVRDLIYSPLDAPDMEKVHRAFLKPEEEKLLDELQRKEEKSADGELNRLMKLNELTYISWARADIFRLAAPLCVLENAYVANDAWHIKESYKKNLEHFPDHMRKYFSNLVEVNMRNLQRAYQQTYESTYMSKDYLYSQAACKRVIRYHLGRINERKKFSDFQPDEMQAFDNLITNPSEWPEQGFPTNSPK